MFLAFHDSSVQIVHKGPSYIYIYIYIYIAVQVANRLQNGLQLETTNKIGMRLKQICLGCAWVLSSVDPLIIQWFLKYLVQTRDHPLPLSLPKMSH